MPLQNFNYSISWSDFTPQSSRPHGSDEDAFTKSIYHHNYNYERNGNAVTISSADVTISMVTSQCWVVSAQSTNDLLQHEQGHYDITALGAREFYNALLQLTAISVHALQTSIAHLHSRCQQKINSANRRYDTQTAHSQNTTVQQTWNRQITTEKQNPAGGIDNLPQ